MFDQLLEPLHYCVYIIKKTRSICLISNTTSSDNKKS